MKDRFVDFFRRRCSRFPQCPWARRQTGRQVAGRPPWPKCLADNSTCCCQEKKKTLVVAKKVSTQPLESVSRLFEKSLARHHRLFPTNNIPQCPAHGLVVHVGLVLVEPPESGDGLGIDQLKDALLAVGPLDIARAAVLVLKEFQQEFPQVRR